MPACKVGDRGFEPHSGLQVSMDVAPALNQCSLLIQIMSISWYISALCFLSQTTVSMTTKAGALVQWLKLPAWKVGDRGFEPHSGLQVSMKKKCFFPAHS